MPRQIVLCPEPGQRELVLPALSVRLQTRAVFFRQHLDGVEEGVDAAGAKRDIAFATALG
jgi:hypothetical protein